jgi:hypothetical protein
MIIQHSNRVCPPGQTPHHGLAVVELSGQLSFLSLYLAKEGFSLRNLGKKL